MKALLISALLAASQIANAAPNPNGMNNLVKFMAGGVAANKQMLNDALVSGLGSYGRVLVGTSNVTNALGSTVFSLAMPLPGNKRAELRAALRVNQQGRTLSYGVSSNPEAYHLDVGFVGPAVNSQGMAIRLDFRPQLTHISGGGTRILVYDSPVMTATGAGRIVATVQQSAINGSPVIWKTNATYIRFVSK